MPGIHNSFAVLRLLSDQFMLGSGPLHVCDIMRRRGQGLGNLMKLAKLVSVCAALVCLAACASSKLKPEDIRMLPYTQPGQSGQTSWPDHSPVQGLREALRHATPERPIKLLVMHGMIVSKSRFSDHIQDQIAAKGLGLVADSERAQVELYRGYSIELGYGPQPVGPVPRTMTSRLTRTIWRDQPGGPPRLIVYEMFWAPVRDDVKYRYLGCFETRAEPRHRADAEVDWLCPEIRAKRNTNTRAAINGGVKDGLMVRGFADAVIVNGAVGDILRDDLSLATCVMAKDTLAYLAAAKSSSTALLTPVAVSSINVLTDYGKTRCDSSQLTQDEIGQLRGPMVGMQNLEYFAITNSLGSYYFMEAQSRRMWGEPVDKQDTVQFQMFDQGTVYMFANQVSLLSLANLKGWCVPEADQKDCPNFRLRSIMDWDSTGGGGLTTYVAFNDVDDMLGYELPPYLADVGFGRLINVSVHNPAFAVPFVFRNPGEVHTRQADNPAIVDAIVNGITIPDPRAP
jgi:hypothetical protein